MASLPVEMQPSMLHGARRTGRPRRAGQARRAREGSERLAPSLHPHLSKTPRFNNLNSIIRVRGSSTWWKPARAVRREHNNDRAVRQRGWAAKQDPACAVATHLLRRCAIRLVRRPDAAGLGLSVDRHHLVGGLILRGQSWQEGQVRQHTWSGGAARDTAAARGGMPPRQRTASFGPSYASTRMRRLSWLSLRVRPSLEPMAARCAAPLGLVCSVLSFLVRSGASQQRSEV